MVKKSYQSSMKYLKPIMRQRDFELAMKDRKLTVLERKSIKHHYFVGQYYFRGVKPKGRSPFQENETILIIKKFKKKMKRFEQDIKRHPQFRESIKALAESFPQLNIFLNKRYVIKNKWDQWTYPPRTKQLEPIPRQKLYDLCKKFGIACFFRDRVLPQLPFSFRTCPDGSALAMIYQRMNDSEIRYLLLMVQKKLLSWLHGNASRKGPEVSFGLEPEMENATRLDASLYGERKEVVCISLSSCLTDQDVRRLVPLIKKAQKDHFPKIWKPLLTGKNLVRELEERAKEIGSQYFGEEKAQQINQHLSREFGISIQRVKNCLSCL